MFIEKILVIGAGGTGSFVLPAIGRFLQSKSFNGRLIIADGDAYEEKNISRQNFAVEMSGMNKAEYQAAVLAAHLHSPVFDIEYLDRFLSKQDVEEIITENTVVINCADSTAIRKYAEDRVRSLKNAAHICCGNELTDGQVQLSMILEGQPVTPSIYEAYPELNSENDDRSAMSCQELSAMPSGGQVIAANFSAAAIAVNYLIQVYENHPIKNKEVVFDTRFNNFKGVKQNVLQAQ